MITIQMYFVYCSCKTLNIINSLLGPNRIKINLSSNVHMTHCTFLARKWRPQTKAQSPTQKTRRCMTWHCADWPCCPPGLKGSWNWLVEPQVDLLFYGIPSFRLLATQFTKIKQREQTSLLLQKYFFHGFKSWRNAYSMLWRIFWHDFFCFAII